MKSSQALCVTASFVTVLMFIGSESADATEFAVLRQRFNHNGLTFDSQAGSQATPVENLDISLNTAQAGALQSVTSSLGILNPDANGVGTAATFDVFYTGIASDFPANSFLDIAVDFTDPVSNDRGRMIIGKIDNVGSGLVSVDTYTQFLGSNALYLSSFVLQMNPAQTGLSLSGIQVVQGTSSDPLANSFFDVFTQLQLNGPGTIDPNVPLFEITMTATTPEPSTIMLAAMGMVALMAVARRKRLR